MKRVGVLGGGQLGRMLALAGYPLGLRFRFLDPAPEAPVGELAELRRRPASTTSRCSTRFPAGLDVITYEFENVPVEAARRLAARVAGLSVRARALEVCQDRLAEKTLFRRARPAAGAVRRRDTRSPSCKRPSRRSACRRAEDAAAGLRRQGPGRAPRPPTSAPPRQRWAACR